MSRISSILATKKKILNVYCTAGYPDLDSTMKVIESLQEHGADMIELGIPYSDPLADGPVIQHSSQVALANGMMISLLFEQLKDMRNRISLPVILMGYLNPILQFGFESFCRQAAEVGIDGLIVPDLPQHEFESQYATIIRKFDLDFIFLVTPETSDQRMKKLDELSTGFLYAVSSSSTTGSSNSIDLTEYLDRLKGLHLHNPILVGFGIRDKTGFEAACQHASGAIIGSAYIKALEYSKDVNATTKSFLSSIRG
jgi:tryptophan synthase alpha chain